MKWILKCIIEDYGKRRWNRFSEEDQILITSTFCANLLEAKFYIQSQKKLLTQ